MMRSRFAACTRSVLLGASCVLAAAAAIGQEPPRPSDAPRPGGPPMAPGGPGFGPGMFLAPAAFELADADKDGKLTPDEAGRAAAQLVRDADAEKKGGVDAAVLGRAINLKLSPPPGFGPDGPPGEFGPGTMLAPRVVELADADKDGKLTPDEAARAATRFVSELDAKGAGAIEPDALAGAINRRMGTPGGIGPGGPMGGEERKVVKDHDRDGDGRLDRAERTAARAALKADRAKGGGGGRGGFPFGPPPGGGPMGGGREEPASPGPRVDPADARTFPGKTFYDPDAFRTLFLEFEEPDWEAALEEFHATDVELPATLTVDGRKYRGVGVHFRGMSSYGMVRAGHKRSFNVSLDYVDPKQAIDGYKTLNLLNSHEDPSFLHAVLYLQIARNYIPAPKANFVKVVVNGESWGVYANAQQFDRTLLAENYPSGKGARWKVRGNPGADGGLTYVGDQVEDYKRRYEIKSGDDEKDWKALIALCKTLNETPPEKLEAALKPMLDVEGVLRFLALDDALINGDGYWTRASDYSIYRDPAGVFHVLPHDTNETFGPAMMFGPGRGPGGFGRGPGGPGRGPGGSGPGGAPGGPGGPGRGPGMGQRPMNVDLDPLVGLDDARTPLRSKLLAVPALRRRYLELVRSIATDWLDWAKLGPIVARYRDLIGPELQADTRKLTSFAAFEAATADEPAPPAPGGRPSMGLRAFADARRRYLLDHPEIKKLAP